MIITPQHRSFFTTFGYLSLPGLLSEEISWITAAFMQAMQEERTHHDLVKRSSARACLERSDVLCRILDLPQIDAVISSLLGPDWNYYSSDGNLYSGDTSWHSDSDWCFGTCIKVPLYFDEIDAGSGALRVIPGSHRRGPGVWTAVEAGNSQQLFGIPGAEVPCVVPPCRPGDFVAIDTNIMHASFGGGPSRRMLALQFWSPFVSDDQYAELDRHMNNWVHSGAPIHSELLHRTAPPSRRRHLLQVGARHAAHPRYVKLGWMDELIPAAAFSDQPRSRIEPQQA